MIRINSNLKQKELAEEFKIQPALLSMYESGVREPSIIFLHTFAKRFSLSLSELFINVDDRIPDDPSVFTIVNDLKHTILDLEKQMLNTK